METSEEQKIELIANKNCKYCYGRGYEEWQIKDNKHKTEKRGCRCLKVKKK